MKLLNHFAIPLLAFAGLSTACSTPSECSSALASVGITSKACVDSSGKACTISNIASVAQQYSVSSGGTSYAFDNKNNIYAVHATAAKAAQLMNTNLVVGSPTCSGTKSGGGFALFDNSCLAAATTTSRAPTTSTITTTTRPATTTPAGTGACNGDLNNCVPILQQRGFIIASQPCKVNGVACALNQLPLEAARLASSLKAPAYGYSASGQIYAISISSSLVANALNAQAYFKTGSATCSGVNLNPFFVFDTSCLAAQLSTTTTTTLRTTLSTTTTTAPATTTTTGDIIQCGQTVSLCSENFNLIQSINCDSLLPNVVCLVGGVVNYGQASLNVCLTNSCTSYGYFGTHIFSSQSTVAQIKAAVAASVAARKCTNPVTINVSDRQCAN